MTVPILRTSERRDFKRCQIRWWWGWREGLKPRGSEKTPLWFGSGVHLGLALWYLPGLKRGVHPAETFELYARDGIHTIKTQDATEEAVAQYENGANLGCVLLEEYVKHYGTDPSWDFVQAEKPFGIDVPWPKEEERQAGYDVAPGELLLRYHGTFDGVYRDLEDEQIKLLETKTAAAIATSHLSLDDQAGSYWAVATMMLRKEGVLTQNERIHGINYNFLRKATPDERPRDAEGYACNKPTKADYIRVLNEQVANDGFHEVNPKCTLPQLEEMARDANVIVLGERSKSQPTPLFMREMVNRTTAERGSQLRRIQDEGVQMQLARDGVLPLTKNPTKDCSWDCSFFAMCELHERGGEWEEFKRRSFVQLDPYADHRKSAEG